jgi:Aspartyl/Asparaginyl beta-hydroxylase
MAVHPLEQQADQAASAQDYGAAASALAQLVGAEPGYFQGWLKLSAMKRASGDAAGALEALRGALAIQPLDFTALLMKATQLHAMGQIDAAGEAYGHALAQAPVNLPPAMQNVISSAETRHRNWQARRADMLRAAVSRVTPLTPRLDALVTSRVRLTPAERAGPTDYCYPGLPDTGFYPESDFGWLGALEDATDRIAAEFEAVVSAEAAQLVPYIQYSADVPVRQWQALNNNRDWTAIHLIRNGERIDVNARHCPQTMASIAGLPQPEVSGAGPNAMFSLLAPGAHIPPHTGISNCRLVCHLPLLVPDGCWFRVADEQRNWRRGTAWVFDDTVEHEALNPSTELRVILIFDVWHPALDAAERAGIAALIEADGGAAAL